jgi:hypothetical protein
LSFKRVGFDFRNPQPKGGFTKTKHRPTGLIGYSDRLRPDFF